MPILVKAILICMTVTSINGAPPTIGAIKCLPMQESHSNAIDEEAFEEYDTVRALFFTPVTVEDNMMHGKLILGASIIPATVEADEG